jgi:two-component system LytT family response regulator
MIRALIVDDEVLGRRGVRTLLSEDRGFEVVGEARNGKEAIASIGSLRPDVVFLDVQMPGLDGFAVIEKVGVAQMPLVVFVTAHDEHALRAFDVQAIDYLVKPFDRERFAMTTARVKKYLTNRSPAEEERRLAGLLAKVASGTASPAFAERFLVKKEGSMIVVRAADVEWVEADGNYVRMHTAGGAHLMTETMQRIEEQLDPKVFARVHRSAIVRLDAIREIQPWFNGGLVLMLRTGAKVQVSRAQRERVLALATGRTTTP